MPHLFRRICQADLNNGRYAFAYSKGFIPQVGPSLKPIGWPEFSPCFWRRMTWPCQRHVCQTGNGLRKSKSLQLGILLGKTAIRKRLYSIQAIAFRPLPLECLPLVARPWASSCRFTILRESSKLILSQVNSWMVPVALHNHLRFQLFLRTASTSRA